jgi:hypothetical protein
MASISADSNKNDAMLQLSLRMFTLNTPNQCNTLFTILRKIINNILKTPNSAKFRTIKLSNNIIQQKIVAIHGGIEFLRSMNFNRVTKSREQLLIMSDENVDVTWLELGLATLNSVELSSSNQQKSKPSILAECTLHIVLPSGHTMKAGFMKEETIGDIYNFVNYSRTDGKRNHGTDTFILSIPYPPKDLVGDEWLTKTVQDAGLTPRSKLIIKKEKRPDALDVFQDNPENKEARENDERLEREKKELKEKRILEKKRLEREAIKLERERTIQSFKEDRSEVIRRVEFETMYVGTFL